MSLCYTIDQKSIQILITGKLFCQNLLLTFILKPLRIKENGYSRSLTWFTTLSLATKQSSLINMCMCTRGWCVWTKWPPLWQNMGSVNHHPSWLITWRGITDLTVVDQSRSSNQGWIWVQRWDRSGPDLVFFSEWEKSGWDGGDGQWGDSSSHRIGTIVKPPESPTVRETGRSKAARFLISLLIPPDLIHPGPACCNPLVRYPPMFNMLMPPTKWMNHRGTRACNHFKKDRCINTPENPCLLVDNRLSVSGAVNRCVCGELGIRF